jgi:alkanesulfonate monooxygenase SsuD/methylene tetrahydromethanopterin reductase-like flavin-dependent oxidoreductase (luciferase family)
MDYGHSLEFGYFLVPEAGDARGVLETARLADGVGYDLLAVQDHADAQAIIDGAAREAGRDPAAIRRIYNTPGAFAARAPAPARDTDEAIVGPPEHWAEVLTHLALDHGFGTFVLLGPPDPGMLRTFIEDVAPRVRGRVAEERRGAA